MSLHPANALVRSTSHDAPRDRVAGITTTITTLTIRPVRPVVFA